MGYTSNSNVIMRIIVIIINDTINMISMNVIMNALMCISISINITIIVITMTIIIKYYS